jgi:hypothetical protein
MLRERNLRMTTLVRRIPELEGNPYRLGRHIRHDQRNRGFAVALTVPIVSVLHRPNNAIAFDQGSLGSCTGNAAVKCVSTAPFRYDFNEDVAVSVYSDATKLDPFAGQYPPDDTGSDGLSVMKVCKSRGYIGAYQWAFTLDQALSALMLGPGICGVEWRRDMFTPDERGRIKPTGAIAGGHELCLIGYDLPHEELIVQNSWGPNWGIIYQGITGCCRLRIDDFASLLATGGDVTFPVVP